MSHKSKTSLFCRLYKPNYIEENKSYLNFSKYLRQRNSKNTVIKCASRRNAAVPFSDPERMKVSSKTMMTKYERLFQYKEILKGYDKVIKENRYEKILEKNLGFATRLLSKAEVSRNEMKKGQIICLRKSASMVIANKKDTANVIRQRILRNESALKANHSMRFQANQSCFSHKIKNHLKQKVAKDEGLLTERYSFFVSNQKNEGMIAISDHSKKEVSLNQMLNNSKPSLNYTCDLPPKQLRIESKHQLRKTLLGKIIL